MIRISCEQLHLKGPTWTYSVSALPSIDEQDESSTLYDPTMILSLLSMKDELSEIPCVNPYQLLKIRRDATVPEIRHQYRHLALWHHPGRHAPLEERKRRHLIFVWLAAALETLEEADSRRTFDHLWTDRQMQRLTKDLPQGDIRVGGLSVVPALSPASSMSSDDSDESQPDTLGYSVSSSALNSAWTSASQAHLPLENPLQLLQCGAMYRQSSEVLPFLNQPTASSDDIHYTSRETDRLFGGPLQLLFRARRWKAFDDPFRVFARVFGTTIDFDRHHVPDPLPELPSVTPPDSRWTVQAEEVSPNTTVFYTTRVLGNRKLTRQEVVRLEKGHKNVSVRVTSEELPPPASDEGSSWLDCWDVFGCGGSHQVESTWGQMLGCGAP